MDALKIPLDGKLTQVEHKKLPLDLLILDITNPRIQYYLDTSLNDTVTQEEVRLALAESNGQYDKLLENIERNKGIINPIWVVPDGNYFRVIEGNTRALIYSELAEKYANDENWHQIGAYVLPVAVDRYKINFIRLEAHLFGSTPWDAYEKARELYRLFKDEDYSINRLSNLTKLTESDIKTNIQAYMDMREQYLPNHNGPGELLKFSYFVEFRRSKDLRRLLSTGNLTLSEFCELVGKGRLGRGEHVRKLAMVWSDEEARNALLEEDMDAALDQLSQTNPAAKSKLFEKVADVAAGLESMEWSEFDEMKRGLHPAKVSELRKLHNILASLLTGLGVKH